MRYPLINVNFVKGKDKDFKIMELLTIKLKKLFSENINNIFGADYTEFHEKGIWGFSDEFCDG